MDKYEYNLKLDEMKSLYADGEYETAAEIADSINWNKIKNVNTLVKAGEIYEKMERYEESKELLMMAYDRSPIGRNIIFRLAEVSIKMKDFDSATEYYNEFVEIAPHDNLRYVIQYNMKKAQNCDYKELIAILEEYKNVEYTEEWAYELAYLYHKTEQSDKCVDACDELILWFGDGPYVERALELKMLYQPLTKTQEEKYRRFRMEKQDVITIGTEEMERAGEYAHEPVEIPKVEVSSRFNTVNLQAEIAKGMQQIMEATEKETVSDTMDNIKRIVEEIPYLQIPKDEEAKELEEQVQIENNINDTLKMNFKELLDEESDGQMSIVTGDEKVVESQIMGQMSIDEVLSEWEKTKRAAEAALQQAEQQKLESVKARALHEAEDIMDRLNDVIPKLDAGISPKTLLEQEYMSAAASQQPQIQSVLVGASSMEPPEDEYPIDMPEEVSEEMSEWEERSLIEDLVKEPLPEVLSLEDEDAEFDGDGMIPEQTAEAAAETEEEPLNKGTAPEIEEGLPQKEAAQGAEEEPLNKGAAPAEEEGLQPQPQMETEKLFDHMSQMLGRHIKQINDESEMIDAKIAQAAAGAAEAATDIAGKAAGTAPQAIAGAAEEVSAVQQAAKEIAGAAEEVSAVQQAAKEIAGTAEEVSAVQQVAGEQEAADIGKNTRIPKEGNIGIPEQPAEEEPGEDEAQDADIALGTTPMQRMKTKPIPTMKDLKKQWKSAKEKKSEMTLPKELDTWKKDLEPKDEEEQHHLTDAQKAVFSYFVPVSGMENQLAKALENISAHLKKKEPAYTSNLVIQGGQGCGKTVLATSMVKALQNEIGKPNNHIGKIDAYALNKKDIQLLLRKVQGGCLIIESAGDMSKQAAVTLSLLLEQDDSGLLVILEDTSKGIKKALAQDDGFAKKFTEKISVPVFTNDDLVAFANSYSKELGYKIDDMAILALYNRISNIQRLDQATTLTEIKDIVDEAIDREARMGLHKYFSILTAKRYTDDDRIILQEKDFN